MKQAATFESDVAEALVSGGSWVAPRNWAPADALLGQRLGIHADEVNLLLGSAVLVGFGLRRSDGTWRVKGLTDEDEIEAAMDAIPAAAKGFWAFRDPVRLEDPVACPGKLSVWKIPKGLVSKPSDETDKVDPVLDIPWKKRKYFQPHVCAVSSCAYATAGFMTLVSSKSLRFRPLCEGCGAKYSPHPLTSLQELARQRKGLADLALVLDATEVAVKSLLEEHGLDDQGQSLVRSVDNTTSVVVARDEPRLAEAQPVASVPAEKLAKAVADAAALKNALGSFFITDQAGMDLAGNITRTVKAQWAELDLLRKEAAAPFDKGKKTVQKTFKPALTALEEIEALLKARVLEGVRRMNAHQDQALEVVQEAYQKGDGLTAALATQHAQSLNVNLAEGVSVRTLIDFRVTDVDAIPRQFFILDDSKVRHALQAGLTIPGIERVDRESVTVRS